MSYKETNAHIMEQVMSSFMTGSSTKSAEIIGYLQTVSKNVERIGSTTWGEPNSWFTSGKFLSSYEGSRAYINIEPDKWLQLHDSINHGSEGATQSTVEWVKEQIENGTESEIPTPTLALEPNNYGEDSIAYVPTKEGRSRGVGAKEAGLDKMPVLVSIRRPTR